MDSGKVSVAALRRLVDEGRIMLADSSPLKAILQQAANTGEQAAAESGGPVPEAIEIMAQPDSMIRMKVVVPGPSESVFQMAIRDGRSVLFASQPDSISFEAPTDLPDLARRLAAEGAHQGPLAGSQVLLWGTDLKLVTAIWGQGKDPDASVSREEAEARLVATGYGERQANMAIGERIMSGALERAGDSVSIEPSLRPWLKLFWSGHGLKVESLPVGDVGERTKLVFIGPSGQRVIAEQVSGETLRERFKDLKLQEAAGLWLVAPTPGRVAALVRALVGLPAESTDAKPGGSQPPPA